MTEFMLLGFSRTGTTVVTELLNTHPDIYCASEVFHPEQRGLDSFNEFMARDAEKFGVRFDFEYRIEAFRRFICFLRQENDSKIIGYNVKYLSLHNLNGKWHELGDAPNIFKLCRENDVKIIHLVRKNYVDVAISNLIAQKTNIWHVRAGDTYKPDRFRINEEDVVFLEKKCKEQVDICRQYLSVNRNVLEINYEDLFDGDDFNEKSVELLAKFLGVDNLFSRQAKLKRLSSEYKNIIINFDQLISPIRASLEDSLISCRQRQIDD